MRSHMGAYAQTGKPLNSMFGGSETPWKVTPQPHSGHKPCTKPLPSVNAAFTSMIRTSVTNAFICCKSTVWGYFTVERRHSKTLSFLHMNCCQPKLTLKHNLNATRGIKSEKRSAQPRICEHNMNAPAQQLPAKPSPAPNPTDSRERNSCTAREDKVSALEVSQS